jgi:hypothetical protein
MSRPAEVDILVAMTREVARYAEKAGSSSVANIEYVRKTFKMPIA